MRFVFTLLSKFLGFSALFHLFSFNAIDLVSYKLFRISAQQHFLCRCTIYELFENMINLIVHSALAYFFRSNTLKRSTKGESITTGYSNKHLGLQKLTNYRKYLPEA